MSISSHKDATIDFHSHSQPSTSSVSSHLIIIPISFHPHPLSYCVPSFHPPLMTSFPFRVRLAPSSLGVCLLLSFFGFMDCSMIILCFIANVLLSVSTDGTCKSVAWSSHGSLNKWSMGSISLHSLPLDKGNLGLCFLPLDALLSTWNS